MIWFEGSRLCAFYFFLKFLQINKRMSMSNENVQEALKKIDERLKKLEAVSHKQPDMKMILKDAAAVLRSVKKKQKLERKETKCLKVRC